MELSPLDSPCCESLFLGRSWLGRRCHTVPERWRCRTVTFVSVCFGRYCRRLKAPLTAVPFDAGEAVAIDVATVLAA